MNIVAAGLHKFLPQNAGFRVRRSFLRLQLLLVYRLSNAVMLEFIVVLLLVLIADNLVHRLVVTLSGPPKRLIR